MVVMKQSLVGRGQHWDKLPPGTQGFWDATAASSHLVFSFLGGCLQKKKTTSPFSTASRWWLHRPPLLSVPRAHPQGRPDTLWDLYRGWRGRLWGNEVGGEKITLMRFFRRKKEDQDKPLRDGEAGSSISPGL